MNRSAALKRTLEVSWVYSPEQPHDKYSILYKFPTKACKNNLERSTDPKGLKNKTSCQLSHD